MDVRKKGRIFYCGFAQIEKLLIRALWHLLHFIVNLWYFALGIANALESYLISRGHLRKFKSLDIDKIQYLAIVIESEEACQSSKVIQLLQWLADIGIKRACLYDMEGILKKSKESILAKLDHAVLFEETHGNNVIVDQAHMTLEFASFSDGKEAVAKAANVLFMKYLKLGATNQNQKEQIFTEPQMTEALKTVGSGGPEPDLLLIYGPARCHLGFPAWRIRYTEIVHMGPLKSMKYGSLIKAFYRFTMVKQNYGT